MNVFLHGARKQVRESLDPCGRAAANVSGGNIAGNIFEQIDIGCGGSCAMELRRWEDPGSRLGVSCGH